MEAMAYNNYGYGMQEEEYQYQNVYARQPDVYMSQPLFTEQELYAFEPAQQNIYRDTGAMDMTQDGGFWADAGCWGQEGKVEDGFYGQQQDMGYVAQPDMLSLQYQYPVSPVTPTESPCQQYASNFNIAAPSAFLLVPTACNGGYQQYNAFQVPMGPIPVSPESYIGNVTVPSGQSPLHPSPYTIPSSVPSPMADPPALQDDDDVLPNHGNTELRGMGLYDDPPDLYAGPGTPGGCSPVTPHDQLRPTLGRGLVLEKSFGLPEEMMMKDEASGQIFKGKIQLDDEEEEEEEELVSSPGPRIYGEHDY